MPPTTTTAGSPVRAEAGRRVTPGDPTVEHAVVRLPGKLPDHVSWAKVVTTAPKGAQSGHDLDGHFLTRGDVYRLPVGCLVVTADRERSARARPGQYANRNPVSVHLWRVDTGADHGLAPVWTQVNKSGKVGARIINGIAVHLRTAPVLAHEPAPVAGFPDRPNRQARPCDACEQMVLVGEGVTSRSIVLGKVEFQTVHTGGCPPRPNTWAGRCVDCRGWIEARAGAVRSTVRGLAPGGRLVQDWYVYHPDGCPPTPEPRPEPVPEPNDWPGACRICWQHVRAGRGLVVGPHGERRLVHTDCPRNPYNPQNADTWVVTQTDAETPDYPVGTVARVALPDGPVDGPGWRPPLGAATEVSVIGVVVAVARHKDRDIHGWKNRRVTTVWRVATDTEAAPVLAGEARRLEEAGLTGRARSLLALLPGAAPADAVRPDETDIIDLDLYSLPAVPVPAGAVRRETTVHVDTTAQVVWTCVHNRAAGDDWRLSNWGGSIVYSHPCTPERAQLINELRTYLKEIP